MISRLLAGVELCDDLACLEKRTKRDEVFNATASTCPIVCRGVYRIADHLC